MREELKPYSLYSESGLPWIGYVPFHWLTMRVKYFLGEIDNRSRTGAETLLSMRQAAGLVPFNEVSAKRIPPEFLVGYKQTQPDDIVLNRMQASNGMFARTIVSGIVSPDYAVFRPLRDVSTAYLTLLFKTPAMRARCRAESKGLGTGTAGFLRLYSDRFLCMHVPLPPRTEQDTIVRFVRAKDQQVHRLLRNKRRLTELLNEQKRAIIEEALRQGILKNRARKTHSDAWVGSIPEDWDVYKIKQIARFNPSKSESASAFSADATAVFLPMERVSVDGGVDCSEQRSVSEISNGYSYFRRHDVVVAKITPCFENGKGAYLGELASDFGFGTTEFVVLRASSKVLPKFLYFLTQTRSFRIRGAEYMTGSAGQKRVPTDFFKNYPIALPDLAEQQEIIDHVERITARFHEAMILAQREIELIREYRTRLVSDVVTGRLDIRHMPVATEQLSPDLGGAIRGEALPEEELDADEGAEEVAIGGE